jgi:basic membrane protein A
MEKFMKAEMTRALRHLSRMPATVLAVASLGLALSAHADTTQPIGVAFVYLGNPGDAGWTYAHEHGVKAIEAQFGDKIQVRATRHTNKETSL